ncbi:MAG: tail fiber domain-containing protein [Bacteroidota bacterium]
MAIPRSDLKIAFSNGNIPDQDDFCDVFDSFFHLSDDHLQLDSQGNLGISCSGTLNHKLEVCGNALLHWNQEYGNPNSDEAILFLGDTNHYIKSIHSTGVVIGTWGANDGLFIQEDSGNVGIGFAPSQPNQGFAPSAKLHVNGDIKVENGKVQILSSNQPPHGETLVLGPTSQSNLRLGYHEDYSWIQSHFLKPLVINAIGLNSDNPVCFGTYEPAVDTNVTDGVTTNVTSGVTIVSDGGTLALCSGKPGGTTAISFRQDGGSDSTRTGFLAFMPLSNLSGASINNVMVLKNEITTNATFGPINANVNPIFMDSNLVMRRDGDLFNTISDGRLKSDIKDLGYGLSELVRLAPKSYKLLGEEMESIGLIAQDVQKIFPEMVCEIKMSANRKANIPKGNDFNDNLLVMNASILKYITINAIKELNQKITTLEKRINETP